MNKLILLVGLPASGKSTFAKKLVNEDTILLSSDALRKELLGDEKCQENNDLVFHTLYSRAKKYLIDGKNVIIDSTNINMKDRRRTLSNFQGMNIERIAIVMATPIQLCYLRDDNRERKVGRQVIDKFLYRFEIPMRFEGFNSVLINKQEENTMYYYDIDDIMSKCDTFEQKNPYHKYTLGKHCEECYNELLKLTKNEDLLIAGKYHDIGKLFTQTFDEEGIAHYYSHHNVGAYMFLCASKHITHSSIFYINYHMAPFSWKEEKTKQKYRELFGDEYYNNLLLLNKCDKIASGVENG